MILNRRNVIIGMGSVGAMAATSVLGSNSLMQGTLPAPQADKVAAQEIISRLPKTDYFAIMEALSKLDQTEKWSTNGEPFNRRWRKYANPLLVDIWTDMGQPKATDCTAWCAITLAWCLKRDGRPVPEDCASSQSYLKYGTPIGTPTRGDLCVFTNRGDSAHGHVTIYNRTLDAGHIEVLGANQGLSDPTNCGANITANVIDLRSMATSTTTHYLNRYIRPPARA